jgi:hypothetical protein
VARHETSESLEVIAASDALVSRERLAERLPLVFVKLLGRTQA